MPNQSLPGWGYLWSEDFRTDVPLGSFPGTAYSANIRVYPSTYYDTSNNIAARRDAGTSGQYNAATVVSVSCGVLRKNLHTVGTRPQVAAVVPYIGGSGKWPGQLYGRYAIRARFPTAIPGYKIAWLLWPDSGTNTTGSIDGIGGNGEIDFPETKLRSPTTVSGFVHYQNATVNNDQYSATNIAVDMTQWHTYEIEWAPTYVAFLLDGREVGRATQRIPNSPMHWVWQTETEISSTPPPVDVAGTLEIDWAAIWRYAPQ
jgi:hypothetical protein